MPIVLVICSSEHADQLAHTHALADCHQDDSPLKPAARKTRVSPSADGGKEKKQEAVDAAGRSGSRRLQLQDPVLRPVRDLFTSARACSVDVNERIFGRPAESRSGRTSVKASRMHSSCILVT